MSNDLGICWKATVNLTRHREKWWKIWIGWWQVLGEQNNQGKRFVIGYCPPWVGPLTVRCLPRVGPSLVKLDHFEKILSQFLNRQVNPSHCRMLKPRLN